MALKGCFTEQATALLAHAGARGAPLRLAKHFSEDRAVLSRWHQEAVEGPGVGDAAHGFAAALGPAPCLPDLSSPFSCNPSQTPAASCSAADGKLSWGPLLEIQAGRAGLWGPVGGGWRGWVCGGAEPSSRGCQWLCVGLRCLISWMGGWSRSGCGAWVELKQWAGTREELEACWDIPGSR